MMTSRTGYVYKLRVHVLVHKVYYLRLPSASSIFSADYNAMLAFNVVYGQNRKERVVLTRCRIGHDRLRHSY